MMTRYVALLRAVNVGGHGKLSMPDLRDFVSALGFSNAMTLLQTGNIVLSGKRAPTRQLETHLESEAAKRLGLTTAFFVRDASDWAEVIAQNPFPDEAKADPSHLVLTLCKSQPSVEQQNALRVAITGHERVSFAGSNAYVVYPDGIGRSKLTHTIIEKKLATDCTGRNWNTVAKIAAALGSPM
jgi:uncharacterized protein (DUF1697 family)